jgi:hypothetical protein
MTSARCPRCDNWAQIIDRKIESHQSNNLSEGGTRYLRCAAAGRTLEEEKEALTPEAVLIRNHRKRARQEAERLEAANRRRFRR